MAFMTASELSKQYQSVLKPANKPEHEVSQITSTSDKYEVKLSIHQFTPPELSVKVVDRYVHVEGHHSEKNDKIGFFTRKFTRKYFLPEGVQPELIRCVFNISNSNLTITAPIVNKTPPREYVIPIIVVGQPTSSSTTSAPAPTQEKGAQSSHGHGPERISKSKEAPIHKLHHPHHHHQPHPNLEHQLLRQSLSLPPPQQQQQHSSQTLPPQPRQRNNNHNHHHQQPQQHQHQTHIHQHQTQTLPQPQRQQHPSSSSERRQQQCQSHHHIETQIQQHHRHQLEPRAEIRF